MHPTPSAHSPWLHGLRTPLLLLAAGTPLAGGCATFQQQVTKAMAEIHEDMKLLDPDNDGLDAFDARTAREIRGMRAELKR